MSDRLSQIRAEILAQPEDDRLEYALDLLAFYLDPAPVFLDVCPRHGLRLSISESRALWCLWRARGRIVSPQRILAAVAVDRDSDDWPAPSRARKLVSSVRAAVQSARLPVAIHNYRGAGWCLEAAPGFDFGMARMGHPERPAPLRVV